MKNIKQRTILILDFGSQYTQLIGRRIRELGVYCEIHPYFHAKEAFDALEPCGLILSGGPATLTKAEQPLAPSWVYEAGVPILGICYGMQLLAHQWGGKVSTSKRREFGHAQVFLKKASPLLHNLVDESVEHPALTAWMSHNDKVSELPHGFEIIACSENTEIAAMADENRKWYGIQFHPEVTQSKEGSALLKRFVVDIAGADTSWQPAQIVHDIIEKIQGQLGTERVLLGLSGGLDSSVTALLLHRAVGAQLVCVFIDTGLLRLNEREELIGFFVSKLKLEVVIIDARHEFLAGLAGITCPEEKRKIIGALFVKIFERESKNHTDIKWLAQGTIYSDVIESGAQAHDEQHVIKSHHNVGGLPDDLSLKLIEPLRALFKDEVRALGRILGLADELVNRHPFPGPGLGIRVLGEVKEAYLDILRQADAVFIETLRQENLYHDVSQAFAVFLPVKSVGVLGDGRHYEHVICLRAVKTIDFMTADWAPLPWDVLAKISNRIINEVPGVSRVCYDISSKPPATIEWE